MKDFWWYVVTIVFLICLFVFGGYVFSLLLIGTVGYYVFKTTTNFFK